MYRKFVFLLNCFIYCKLSHKFIFRNKIIFKYRHSDAIITGKLSFGKVFMDFTFTVIHTLNYIFLRLSVNTP